MSTPLSYIPEEPKTQMVKCPFCKGHMLIDGERYTCYSCFRTGDIVDFLSERDKISHQKAEWKALREKPDEDKIKRLKNINAISANYFSSQKGTYFEGRLVSDETLQKFHLGYAPLSGDELLNLLKDKFSISEIIESGLFYENGNEIFPFFRNRAMFPIYSINGSIVGFGGRRLNDESKAPKYLNTGENIIFHKRDLLYGLDKAKGEKTLYFVEGYMDVIALHQAGIINAVAALGTAVGERHCTLLHDYNVRNIVLCLDGDEAGIKSALKSIPILRKYFNVSVITLSEAKDPDEFIKTKGVKAFCELNAVPSEVFLLKKSKTTASEIINLL